MRPLRIFGKLSLLYLQIYLDGFNRTQWEISGVYPDGLKEFTFYVRDYFKDKRNVGWASIILSHTESEEEAFETFYKLFDGYMDLIKNK